MGISFEFLKRSAAAAVIAGSASVAHGRERRDPTILPEPSWSLVLGGRTEQPYGHADFCIRYPAQCQQTQRDSGPIILTPSIWQRIVNVNAQVNRSIQPVTDILNYGVEERWVFPKTRGDCEDFALEKRRRLIAAGIPHDALLMTVVAQGNGEGHAVLTVRTDRGDFFLDNLFANPTPIRQSGYRIVKAVDPAYSGRWLNVVDLQGPSHDVYRVARVDGVRASAP
jgi:predicted transglutaminase-like cysteine proteinase